MQPAKTAWDVLQLLIVPVLLVLIALYFNSSQASRDRSREDRRIRQDRVLAEDTREDATLDGYIAKMSSLMLDRGLLKARPGSAVRQVARTATLATVRRLSGSRKGEVVKFLLEAGLLAEPSLPEGGVALPTVDLQGADLRGADLSDLVLIGRSKRRFFHPKFLITKDGKIRVRRGLLFRRVLLGRVALWGDLRRARFDRARLETADFSYANLRGASFKRASMESAYFYDNDLRNVSFERAALVRSAFWDTRFHDATFDNAFITDTTFDNALFKDVSFVGTTFARPDRVFATGSTSFVCAKGTGIDFSHAKNLASLDVRGAILTNVQMDGAKERPHGWEPSGLHPEKRDC